MKLLKAKREKNKLKYFKNLIEIMMARLVMLNLFMKLHQNSKKNIW